MQTPLRRTLGNTKLKTRQDVRRFRKFLKRNYDFQTISLVEIDPETLKNYLIHYLTSIRTRKGSQYDPETLRSYYLSIQRFLKDSNYPFCLRNSPQFAQCRDLIIQMRKEKHQNKFSEPKAKRSNEKKSIVEENPKKFDAFCFLLDFFTEIFFQRQHFQPEIGLKQRPSIVVVAATKTTRNEIFPRAAKSCRTFKPFSESGFAFSQRRNSTKIDKSNLDRRHGTSSAILSDRRAESSSAGRIFSRLARSIVRLRKFSATHVDESLSTVDRRHSINSLELETRFEFISAARFSHQYFVVERRSLNTFLSFDEVLRVSKWFSENPNPSFILIFSH